LLVAALSAAILWGANPTSRAAARDDGALRLHLPFALTGPRDIRGNERTTRSYRAISPHAPQPISDVMARIIVSAATSLDGMEAVIVRQPSAHNQLDVGVFDAAPAAHRSLLLISHEAIVPIPPGAAIGPSTAGMDMRWDAQAMAPIAIMPLVLLAQARPPVARIPVSDLMQPRTRAEHGLQTVRIGSAGGRSASRMAAMLLAHASSLQQLHLDYNGGQSALNALVASEIDFLFAALPLVLPYVDAGRLRALGLASTERFPLLPQLPTLAEQGAPELVWEGWFGLYASRAISPRVREPLLGRVAESLASGPIRSVLLQQGLQPADPDAARFAARIAADRDRGARLLSGVD
jgi:tripartite-type tricarboxylate transporter receptor subunit TctC